MKIRLSRNSYIRIYENGAIGYINNQLTRHDTCYNEIGADFLSEIKRTPEDVDSIVDRLYKKYQDVNYEELYSDFNDFIEELYSEKYITIGENEKELDNNDLAFSYDIKNYKDLGVTNQLLYPVEDTETFIAKYNWKNPRLVKLEIELTSKCNERCIHCYIPNDKKNHGFDMPLQVCYKVIDQFAELGGLYIELSGGEALLHKDLKEILRYCRKKDLQIALLTNLVFLKDDLIPVIKETNVALVQVSLYSMNPEIHDYITKVNGSFEKTKASIEKLHDANIPLQISCPIMKANQDGYGEILKYAQSLNVKAQTDFVMMAQADLSTDNLANRLNLEETEVLIKNQIIKYDVDYKDHINAYIEKPITDTFKEIENIEDRPICGAGLSSLCITSNGDLYPCAGWQGMTLGNINKESLNSIWLNSEKLKLIRGYRYKDFPKCIKCEAKDYCSICLVRNYNESGGDALKINEHFCKVAYLNKKLVEEYIKTTKS